MQRKTFSRIHFVLIFSTLSMFRFIFSLPTVHMRFFILQPFNSKDLINNKAGIRHIQTFNNVHVIFEIYLLVIRIVKEYNIISVLKEKYLLPIYQFFVYQLIRLITYNFILKISLGKKTSAKIRVRNLNYFIMTLKRALTKY